MRVTPAFLQDTTNPAPAGFVVFQTPAAPAKICPAFRQTGKGLRKFVQANDSAPNARDFPLAFRARVAILVLTKFQESQTMKPLTLIQILALTLLAVVGAQASSGLSPSAPQATASEIQTDL